MFRAVYIILGLCLFLSACGAPATDTQISSYHSNRTIYSADHRSVAFLRSDGTAFTVENGRKLKGRWFAQNGKLCLHLSPDPLDCKDMFIDENGVITTALGGYNTAKGDGFDLVRKFSPRSSRSGSSGVSAGAFVRGLIGGIVATCANGACSEPAPSNSGGQCQARKGQCYASCQGLSRNDYSSITSLSSSFTKCEARCAEIRC